MHLSLDRESDLVKQFVRSLPVNSEGIELELDGRVICKVVPPLQTTEKQALIERGRELVRRAQQRNQGVPARVVEREVREAVEEVRQRKSR